MNESIIFLAALAAALTAGLTFALLRYAQKRKIFIATIRARDSHKVETPRIGGIAVTLSFIIVSLLVAATNPSLLSFSDSTLIFFDRNLLGILLAVLLLLCVNAYDDFLKDGLDWRTKIISQLFAAFIIYYFGVNIPWLTNPFGERLYLESWSWVFVIVWLVTTMNAVNWLDGVDGLAGGVSAITFAVIASVAVALGSDNQVANLTLSAICLGAVVGFLPFNFSRRFKVFLGDTGSVFLGLLIGVLAIISGGKVATVFLLLAIPFLDALTVIIYRLVKKTSPFKADRNHLHHKLMDLGFKPWQVTIFYYAVSLFFALIALNTQSLGKFWAILLAIAMMVTLILIYTLAPILKKGKDGGRVHFPG